MKKYVIPIIIPYPQDKENMKNTIPNEEDIKKIIEEHLAKIKEETFIEIEFSGGISKELLDVAYEYVQSKKVKAIRISTRPNYINKKSLKILKKYKIKTIELEVQSTNDYILKRLEMNYNLKDIKKASRLIRMHGFKLGHQIMIGLPESTKIDDINTAKTIIKMKPRIISVTPVLVIKGTELEKEYQEQKYKPLTLVQAVETCKELVQLFNNKKIEIIAIGYGILDNDLEQLEIAENVIDGPFHPSFRQLVESSLWYDAIVNKIKQLNVKVMQVEVTVNPIDVNNVIGYKQENINKLKELYDVDLIVTPNSNIKQGKSKIDITEIYQDFKN